MAPKGGNAKKESGRAKKAENEEKKKVAAEKVKEAKEADEWKSGAKGTSKADVAAAKAAEAARKKAEREALLASEEASLPSKAKSAPKAGAAKKKPVDKLVASGTGVAGFSVNDPLNLRKAKGPDGEPEEVKELSAKGIDEMLEALELVNQKTDKATVGSKAEIMVDAHPERRFKAAFEAYLDREMPILKQEHPGLRQNQMRDMLYKQFQKAPENPFNQAKIAYNATKEEKVEAYKKIMENREAKYSRA
ncbi:hypothetical protein I307_03360 [Cryptococcus deuterogattii 99/473]|uniref:DUF1014-domain-containing protein n=2 Tax=Cryptococcus deuterogattii TaxID=1859096 RepID=A0A0D0U5S9_9TREE|nr:hypothetical protein CNBG_3336 [Cryptococcus deuterogattii R265]KIR30250.1 hypothetical protein I309_00387 [Cryptococcus deuterogattii LA55]KIR43558.1 hypothetical protein I313_00400 [Cryptococcus deuterogattii Ram5]KIR74892.1 hypothetical protein I310_01166 [Cryptococcus deuterogattii CA1014]KIR92181.1 hypothetical protein I304_03585 [Cryptococcus deuterogattii CBS 10090]KIS01347.1 hypothetical protein L804_01225 [Cryptococcus deuterogattii 2001/935-1]KIY57026.1 hypothetical protein I307_